jgi:hypothetical protein
LINMRLLKRVLTDSLSVDRVGFTLVAAKV